MAQIIKQRGSQIVLNAEVSEIQRSGKIIKAVKYQQDGKTFKVAGDIFISTMPLTDFILRLNSPAQSKIQIAAEKLRYRAVAFLFMTLDQRKISDNDALYVPEPKYIFFRIEQYKFWSMKMVPSRDKTSLCLEITCFKDDQVWHMPDKEMYQRAIEGLSDAGLIKNDKVVMDWWVERKNYVYPVFEIGYQKHAQAIRAYADSFTNLITYGRQGYYQYIHMHHVVAKGIAAADWVMSRTTKEAVQTLGTKEEYLG
jgi:protoporphyrinogen oxidase